MRFKRPLLLAIAILAPLLIGATFPGFVDQVRTLAVSLTAPVLKTQDQVGHFLKTELGYLIQWHSLRSENEALKTEVAGLRSELLKLEELKHEKERLEQLLNLKQRLIRPGVAARVIARDPSQWTHFAVIDKGYKDGVRKNTVLIHPSGLVGKVVAAGAHASRAILLIDGKSRVSALNQKSRDEGLVEGTGLLVLKMTYLDNTAEIHIGDTIIASGSGGVFPKGIPIGQVQLVGRDKDRLGVYALVKPFVSFSKLEEVLCVSSQTNA